MMEILESEVLRYLGYRGAPADKRVKQQVKEAVAELKACAAPKSVYGKWTCRTEPDGRLQIGSMEIKSRHLAAHIKGCEQVVLLAATLGTEADTLIRRYSVSDIGKAAVMQAVCTAKIEAYCDSLDCRIAAEAAEDGLYTRPRFSPGYGDFSISHQKDMLHMLDCGRRIGLTLAGSYLMIPAKSVTALIGLTKESSHTVRKCDSCPDLQCAYRKE